MNINIVTYIHDEILKKEAGLPGVDPSKSLSSILNRIETHHHYNGIYNIYEIAALYAFAIVQGYGFNDANKRTAFLSMYVFLYINGYHLTASDYTQEIEDMMVAIAKKEISEKDLQQWLKKNTQKNVTKD